MRTSETRLGRERSKSKQASKQINRRRGWSSEIEGLIVTDLSAGVLRLDGGPELGDLEPFPFPRRAASSARHVPLLDLAAAASSECTTSG